MIRVRESVSAQVIIGWQLHIDILTPCVGSYVPTDQDKHPSGSVNISIPDAELKYVMLSDDAGSDSAYPGFGHAGGILQRLRRGEYGVEGKEKY